MELRTLGRTGVKVSPLCLGAMMFGAWGNTDREACVRIIHRALDAGINFIDTSIGSVFRFREWPASSYDRGSASRPLRTARGC